METVSIITLRLPFSPFRVGSAAILALDTFFHRSGNGKYTFHHWPLVQVSVLPEVRSLMILSLFLAINSRLIYPLAYQSWSFTSASFIWGWMLP
ncbi:hypothetical protein D3C76_1572310 [compost metagenome]